MEKITFAEFRRKYKPVKNTKKPVDGMMGYLFDVKEDAEYINAKSSPYTWSVVMDGDKKIAIPGKSSFAVAMFITTVQHGNQIQYFRVKERT